MFVVVCGETMYLVNLVPLEPRVRLSKNLRRVIDGPCNCAEKIRATVRMIAHQHIDVDAANLPNRIPAQPPGNLCGIKGNREFSDLSAQNRAGT